MAHPTTGLPNDYHIALDSVGEGINLSTEKPVGLHRLILRVSIRENRTEAVQCYVSFILCYIRLCITNFDT